MFLPMSLIELLDLSLPPKHDGIHQQMPNDSKRPFAGTGIGFVPNFQSLLPKGREHFHAREQTFDEIPILFPESYINDVFPNALCHLPN